MMPARIAEVSPPLPPSLRRAWSARVRGKDGGIEWEVGRGNGSWKRRVQGIARDARERARDGNGNEVEVSRGFREEFGGLCTCFGRQRACG